MRFALLSDIHANMHALDACLEHARTQNTERFAFLGDMVGYGADPSEVVDCIQHMVADGAIALKGNHDAMAVEPPPSIKTVGDSTAQWTHDHLTPEQRAWIDARPLTEQHESTLFVHASADGPELWRYVYDQRAATASLDAAVAGWPNVRYVFGGHVHQQSLYYRGSSAGLMMFTPEPGVAIPVPKHRQWLSTVGSAGQPRDGKPLAMYAVFDSDRAQLTFHRVPYDYHAAAAAIRRSGLPDFFADRLESGR